MTRTQLNFLIVNTAVLIGTSIVAVCAPQQRTLGDGYPVLLPADQEAYYRALVEVESARITGPRKLLHAREVILSDIKRRYTAWCEPYAYLKVAPNGIPQCAIKVSKK